MAKLERRKFVWIITNKEHVKNKTFARDRTIPTHKVVIIIIGGSKYISTLQQT